MPRMDNSDPHVLAVVNGFRRDRGEPPIVFNEDDPGDTQPVDICWDDWWEIFDADGGYVPHPSYEDSGRYYCAICGDILTDDDA